MEVIRKTEEECLVVFAIFLSFGKVGINNTCLRVSVAFEEFYEELELVSEARHLDVLVVELAAVSLELFFAETVERFYHDLISWEELPEPFLHFSPGFSGERDG